MIRTQIWSKIWLLLRNNFWYVLTLKNESILTFDSTITSKIKLQLATSLWLRSQCEQLSFRGKLIWSHFDFQSNFRSMYNAFDKCIKNNFSFHFLVITSNMMQIYCKSGWDILRSLDICDTINKLLAKASIVYIHARAFPAHFILKFWGWKSTSPRVILYEKLFIRS